MSLSAEMESELATIIRQLQPEAGKWSVGCLDWFVDLYLVSAHLDVPGAPPPSVLAGAVQRFVLAQHRSEAPETAFTSLAELDESDRNEFLEQAGGFVPPEYTSFLADRLEESGLYPQSTRLAAMLARQDPERVTRLILRIARAEPNSAFLIRSAAEALLAARQDSPLAEVRSVWDDLSSRQHYADELEALLTARLRMTARENPVEALELLRYSIDEVGAGELGEGTTSVVVRAAESVRENVWSVLCERIEWLLPRILVLRDLTFHGQFGELELERWEELFAELATPRNTADTHPIALWESTLGLLAVAANAGRSDLALRVIKLARPAPWAIFVSTWPESRRRALREGIWPVSFWDDIRKALTPVRLDGFASQPPLPHPPLGDLPIESVTALWKIKTLPLSALPWWTAWGAEVP